MSAGRKPTPLRPPGKQLVKLFGRSKIAGLRRGVFRPFRPPRIRLGQNSANSGARDVMVFRDLPQAPAMRAIVQDGSAVYLHWWTADLPALEFRPAHAAAHALDQQVSF